MINKYPCKLTPDAGRISESPVFLDVLDEGLPRLGLEFKAINRAEDGIGEFLLCGTISSAWCSDQKPQGESTQ